MRVEFYRISTPDGTELHAMLTTAKGLPNDESLVQKIMDVPFRLQRIVKQAGHWEGDMVRIRMNQIPIIASLKGDVDELELEDDEGIGEETAFLYDQQTKVLALQVNRFGVPASRFAKYFEQLAKISEPITADMVLRKDVTDQLNRLQVVKKFTVRFAGMTTPSLVTQHEATPHEAVSLVSGRVPVVEVTMAMGRERGSLSVDSVVSAAKKLWRNLSGGDNFERVLQVKVSGALEDDSPLELNLLEFKMSEIVDVPYDSHRRMSYNDRRGGIREAWERRRDQLEGMFPVES